MNNLPSVTRKVSLWIFLSVFLVSFTGLTLQVTLTRIFSVSLFYHYAFMAISIALFGWGLGGIVLFFLKKKLRSVGSNVALAFILAYSISMPIYILSISQFQFLQDHIVVYYAISFIPFLLAGTSLAFFYSKYSDSANKLYLADLGGASFACLVVEPILVLFGAESTVLLLGVIGSVVSLSLATIGNRRRTIALGLVIFIFTFAFFAVNVQDNRLNVSGAKYKGMSKILKENPELIVSFSKWNSFSRINVVEGFSGAVQAIIYIDAGAATEVLKWDGKFQNIENIKDTAAFLPFYLVESPKTLIIGSGGGKDVLIALAANSSKIIAVELNPIVIEAVQRFREETSDIYNNPRVELYIDDGRSFTRRSEESFDVITLTLVDSYAAISSGGYALVENYLYSKEAFIDYLYHLTDNGLLALVRWSSEVPRLVSTTIEALTTFGVNTQDVGKHIAVVMFESDPSVGCLFVVKKAPFTQVEAEMFLNKTLALGPSYNPFYIPYLKNDTEPYRQLFDGSISFEEYCNEFSYRVDAVTDDSPYFFNFEKTIPDTLGDLTKFGLSLVFLSIVVPWTVRFLASKRKDSNLIVQSNLDNCPLSLFVLYFSALGLGYILIEIAVMQKFILFLGYPTRALTAILFSLLASSGIGSFVSGQLASGCKAVAKCILLACLLIIVISSIYVLALPKMFDSLIPLPSSTRMAITFLLIFPLGFFMGMPFPLGIRELSKSSDESVPWIWGINGAMSVLGSIFAVITSIFLGFSYAIMLGTGAYFIALLCGMIWIKRLKGW